LRCFAFLLYLLVSKKTRVFRVFNHFGSAEDPVITNNAEGKPKENPAASWVFLVTVPVSLLNPALQGVSQISPLGVLRNAK
jgi:hypothetical protein